MTSDIPDTFDTSELSFDDLAEIRSFVDGSISATGGELTPGECQMARAYYEDGLPPEEIADQFTIDQRQLTPHLDGFCNCDEKREGQR